MVWVIIGLLALVCLLLVIGMVRQGKMSDLELENCLLKEENEELNIHIDTLQHDLDTYHLVQEEIQKIEETKNKKKKTEPSAPGDVDSRLDRLNKLSDKKS